MVCFMECQLEEAKFIWNMAPDYLDLKTEEEVMNWFYDGIIPPYNVSPYTMVRRDYGAAKVVAYLKSLKMKSNPINRQ